MGDRLYVFGNATLQTGERIDLDPTSGVDEFVADVTDRYLYVLEFEVPG